MKLSAAKSSKSEEAEEQEWRAEDDLRTLISAEKIKADKPRMDRAMKKHKEMKAAMMKVGI